MKLTSKERDFIRDASVLLDRGQKSISVDLNQFDLQALAEGCKYYLKTDVWFNKYKHPHQPLMCTMETNFSRRYINDLSIGKVEFLTPKPFEIILNSNLLEATEEEQIERVKDYNEWYIQMTTPKPKPLTFWQKIKRIFK